MKTLKELLDNLTLHKGITFIGYKQDKFKSYKEIYDSALFILFELQKQGVSCGDELIFQLEDNEKFIQLLWACILGGIKAVPCGVFENYENVINILSKLNNPKICFTKNTYENIKNITKNNFDIVKSKAVFYSEENKIQRGKTVKSSLDDIVIIQFSSGSTGSPKGVALTNKNIISNIEGSIERFKKVTVTRALSWLPLSHNYGLIGVHLSSLLLDIDQYYIPTKMFLENPMIWMNKINEYKIEITSCSNFAYKYFLKVLGNKNMNWDLSALKMIITGSEHISYELCKMFTACMKKYKLRENCILPAYGMTEASLVVTYYHPEENLVVNKLDRSKLKIGEKIDIKGNIENQICFVDSSEPICDMKIRICSNQGVILSEDYIGNIQIKGDSLMSGYYNDEEETKKSFTEDGWFRTGDIGFLKNNRLTVIGRSKDVIIINGKNYYSEDIEAVIRKNISISYQDVSVCGVLDDKENVEKVIAFIESNVEENEFFKGIEVIKKKILHTMGLNISYMFLIKMLPRTDTGKVKKYILINKYLEGSWNLVKENMDKLEGLINYEREDKIDYVDKMVLQICREITKRNNIKITDSIFDIQANSLQIANIVVRINEEFETNLKLDSVMKMTNLKFISEYLRKNKEEKNLYQVSSQQKRFYALNLMDSKSINYNLPAVMWVDGNLDTNKSEYIFNQIINRHESLRTSFQVKDGMPVQIINKDVKLKILKNDINENEIEKYIYEFIQPFDLSKAPLIRIVLLKLSKNRGIFIMDIHHIITDGTSMGILINEFMKLYNNEELPKLEFQYKDYCNWQNDMISGGKFINEEKHWMKIFEKPVTPLNLPLDFNRPSKRSFNGDSITFFLGAKLKKALDSKVKQRKISLFTILLSALDVLLSKYSGQDDIIVGTPVSGRSRAEFMNTVGAFINTVIIRSFPNENKLFVQLEQENERAITQAIENQDYQLEMLVEKIKASKDKSRNPLFDVMITMWNMDLPDIKLKDVKFTNYEIDDKSSKVDMGIIVQEKDDDIKFKLSYCTDLFKRDTALKVREHFINILKIIVNNDEVLIKDIDILSKYEMKNIEIKNKNQKFDLEFKFNF